MINYDFVVTFHHWNGHNMKDCCGSGQDDKKQQKNDDDDHLVVQNPQILTLLYVGCTNHTVKNKMVELCATGMKMQKKKKKKKKKKRIMIPLARERTSMP